jgi:hypothetical protein
MRNVKKLEDINTGMKESPEDISKLRLKFANENPDLIARIFQGDAAALEAFTNFGGIQGRVTKVDIRDLS